MEEKLRGLFESPILIDGNLILLDGISEHKNQEQTNQVFGEKWGLVNDYKDVDKLYDFQYEWYLKLYGFASEKELAAYLDGKVIIDAGCGLGYKASWFAKLAPTALVIGMDFSDAALNAANNYKDLKNLFFVKGDIANTKLKTESLDYVSCDQVIMHTERPDKTFAHLASLLKPGSEFACYVYAKKALPRELLDDFFRLETHNYTTEQLWEMSDQLTELGKRLSDLKITIDIPDIPLLGIKGGEQDLQRFIYWNFIKCFYKPEWSKELNDCTNFDWYSPSNAKRYSEDEFMKMVNDSNLSVEHFHSEEACYSGRFKKA